MLVTNLMDLVIVSRVNKSVGIPDECLIFGDITLTPMVKRFLMLPTFVLAAKICPEGAEATLFSLLMALSNFGSDVAIYFGSFLVVVLGVDEDHYGNFLWVIVVKSLFRLSPIPLFYILLPTGSPQRDDDFSQFTLGGAGGMNADKFLLNPSRTPTKLSEPSITMCSEHQHADDGAEFSDIASESGTETLSPIVPVKVGLESRRDVLDI
jgi:hypothetical protein